MFGDEHPFTLSSMNNLDVTYQCLGRWSKAEELGVSVVEMRKRVLGEEYPLTAQHGQPSFNI